MRRNERVAPPNVSVDDYFSLDKSCFYRRGPDADVLTANVGSDTLPLYMRDLNRERTERRRLALKAALLQQGLPEDVANDVAERSVAAGQTSYNGTVVHDPESARYAEEVRSLGGNAMLHEVLTFARELPVDHRTVHEVRPRRRGDAAFIPQGERALAPVTAAANRKNHARLKWGNIDLGDANDIEFRDDLDAELDAIRSAYASRPPIVSFPEQVAEEARRYARSELGTDWETFDPMKHSDYDAREQLRAIGIRKQKERESNAVKDLDKAGGELRQMAWDEEQTDDNHVNPHGVVDVNEKPRWDWISADGPSEALQKIRESDLWKPKNPTSATGQTRGPSPRGRRKAPKAATATEQEAVAAPTKDDDDGTKSVARSFEQVLRVANRYDAPRPAPDFLVVDENDGAVEDGDADPVMHVSQSRGWSPSRYGASPGRQPSSISPDGLAGSDGDDNTPAVSHHRDAVAPWRSPQQIQRPPKIIRSRPDVNEIKPRKATVTFKASDTEAFTVTTRNPPPFAPRANPPRFKTGREIVLDSTSKSEKELSAKARSRVVGSGGREGAITALFAAADRPPERRMHTEGIMAFFSCGVEGFDPVLAKEHQAMPIAELLKDDNSPTRASGGAAAGRPIGGVSPATNPALPSPSVGPTDLSRSMSMNNLLRTGTMRSTSSLD